MSAEVNKALSNRMAQAIGTADFDAFDELMAPGLAEEFKQGIAELRLAFPDHHGTNEIQVAQDEMVANRFVFCGTPRVAHARPMSTSRTQAATCHPYGNIAMY